MNAFDRAMKAIEAAIARGKPAPKKRQPPKKARVVSAKPRHKKPEAYNPPRVSRAERRVRQSLGQVRRYEPVPAPTPPEVPGPISAPLYVPPRLDPAQPVSTRLEPAHPVPTSARPAPVPHWTDAYVARPAPRPPPPGGRARGSCKAIDADNGRQCKLPAHPESPDGHRSERGPFTRVATSSSEYFPLQQALDQASLRRPNVEVYAGASHVKGERIPTITRWPSTPKVKRDKAHAGEPLTEDHPSRENAKRAEMGGGI